MQRYKLAASGRYIVSTKPQAPANMSGRQWKKAIKAARRRAKEG